MSLNFHQKFHKLNLNLISGIIKLKFSHNFHKISHKNKRKILSYLINTTHSQKKQMNEMIINQYILMIMILFLPQVLPMFE